MSQGGGEHTGTTHGPVNTQGLPSFGTTWAAGAESAKYLLHFNFFLIILLFPDNDRFDHYLYKANSSNQEGNLAARRNYLSAGKSWIIPVRFGI